MTRGVHLPRVMVQIFTNSVFQIVSLISEFIFPTTIPDGIRSHIIATNQSLVRKDSRVLAEANRTLFTGHQREHWSKFNSKITIFQKFILTKIWKIIKRDLLIQIIKIIISVYCNNNQITLPLSVLSLGLISLERTHLQINNRYYLSITPWTAHE